MANLLLFSVPVHKSGHCPMQVVYHFGLDRRWWHSPLCMFAVVMFQCQVATHQRRQHRPSLWMHMDRMIAVNKWWSTNHLQLLCKCHNSNLRFAVNLPHQSYCSWNLAMQHSWNFVSHHSNYDGIVNIPMVLKSIRFNANIYYSIDTRNAQWKKAQYYEKHLTSITWIAIDLTKSNVPMSTERIALGRFDYKRNWIVARKIGD